MQLLPTTFPSISATTQYIPELKNIIESKPVVWAGSGKSVGKPWAVLILENAAKQIWPQLAASSIRAGLTVIQEKFTNAIV
jgi:hypothetical protein